MKNLINNIKGTFSEWIRSLTPGEKWYRLPLEKESSLFLTFNYTPTLETIYRISKERILYIHGSIESEEYILGHGLSYQEIESQCESDDECSDCNTLEEIEQWYRSHADDFMTEQVKEVAIQRMYDLRKDVNVIIADNHTFFEQLKDIRVIHIYGFSFSPIDMPYIHTIISNIDKETVIWEINFFSERDKENIENFIEKVDIPKDNVKLIRLTDIQLDPQLKIPFE